MLRYGVLPVLLALVVSVLRQGVTVIAKLAYFALRPGGRTEVHF